MIELYGHVLLVNNENLLFFSQILAELAKKAAAAAAHIKQAQNSSHNSKKSNNTNSSTSSKRRSRKPVSCISVKKLTSCRPSWNIFGNKSFILFIYNYIFYFPCFVFLNYCTITHMNISLFIYRLRHFYLIINFWQNQVSYFNSVYTSSFEECMKCFIHNILYRSQWDNYKIIISI